MIYAEEIYLNGGLEFVGNFNNPLKRERVIVTFLETKTIDLPSQGIDKAQVELLRTSLATFAEDWNSPEMIIYDDYHAAKAKL